MSEDRRDNILDQEVVKELVVIEVIIDMMIITIEVIMIDIIVIEEDNNSKHHPINHTIEEEVQVVVPVQKVKAMKDKVVVTTPIDIIRETTMVVEEETINKEEKEIEIIEEEEIDHLNKITMRPVIKERKEVIIVKEATKGIETIIGNIMIEVVVTQEAVIANMITLKIEEVVTEVIEVVVTDSSQEAEVDLVVVTEEGVEI